MAKYVYVYFKHTEVYPSISMADTRNVEVDTSISNHTCSWVRSGRVYLYDKLSAVTETEQKV